ncbi:MAG: hypothetical protein VR75_11675 [Hyphomonadaceae bacterium BRH_c29]|nr:MAG: hypothetical protein VR75_11675 [Hyphomonadaceae bacterium BRH_c29]
MRAGLTLMNKGTPAEGLEFLRRAESLRPTHLSTLQAVATAFLRTGDAASALERFGKALAVEPACSAALHGKGLALHALGDRFGALTAFRAMAAQDPDAWKAWQSIADITDDEGERLVAIDQAAVILARLCAGPAAPAQLLPVCADSLVQAHRHEDAREFITLNAARFRTPADACNRLADAHYQAGAFREAFFHKARALDLLTPEDIPPPRPAQLFDTVAAMLALEGISAILRARGIRFFLVAGTLLGLVRDGALLTSDRDVDIGVFRSRAGTPDIAGLVRTHPDLFLRRDARPGERYYAILYKGTGIDIFLHDTTDDGHVTCGVGDHPGDIQWRYDRFGLADAHLAGKAWQVPEDPSSYLRQTYGQGWQDPDPGFASAISSPALYQVDPYARAYYSVARARKALLTGDRDKARALLSQSPIPMGELSLFSAAPPHGNSQA